MANVFTRFLKGVGDGLLTPKGGLGDFRHASRLFVENNYRLLPRSKFMFYVQFEIDKSVLSSQTFTATHADEIGYLIKSTDLPKYKFETVTKNQYNRKHIIYKNFTYEGLSMKFHDDSAGVINALWTLYMGSYVQDRFNPQAAFERTNLRAAGTPVDNYRYSLDKQGKSADFFKSITIYTMSRRRFLSYKLVNPKITSWAHGDAGYSANEFNETSMQIEYESVVYGAGSVARNTPKGFANLYYDNVPSPLTVAGGGVGNLLGEGGVLDGLESIFGDVSNGSAFGSIGGFLGTAIKAVNTAKNIGKLSGKSLRSEALGLISSPAALRGVFGAVGGIAGLVLPKNSGSGNTTATPKNFVDQGQFL